MDTTGLTPTQLQAFQSLLKQLVQEYQLMEDRDKFFVLTHDPYQITAGVGQVSGVQTTSQGLDTDFYITDMTKYSDFDFTFNFGLVGTSALFFNKEAYGSAMFLGTLPLHLTRAIKIPKGSGVQFQLTNKNAAANNVQLAFIGFKRYESAAAKNASMA